MNIKSVVKRISGGKWGSCSGQACIAVDYILVEQSFASSLVSVHTQRKRKRKRKRGFCRISKPLVGFL